MFGQINHTAEIATCAYFFGFQKTDKVNRNYFSFVEKWPMFSTRNVTRTSQTYRRQNQSACPACYEFLSRRTWLPWHVQKMCAVTIVGTIPGKALNSFRKPWLTKSLLWSIKLIRKIGYTSNTFVIDQMKNFSNTKHLKINLLILRVAKRLYFQKRIEVNKTNLHQANVEDFE